VAADLAVEVRSLGADQAVDLARKRAAQALRRVVQEVGLAPKVVHLSHQVAA